MDPLRGLCSNSSEQQPPVASMAWRCRCGSTSIGREPPARSEVSDGATVSVPPGPPAAPADPGRVSRVGREFCDMKWLEARRAVTGPDCTRSIDVRQLLDAGGRGTASAGRSILWGLALLPELTRGRQRPATPFGRLTTCSVRFRPDRKGLPRSA